MTEEAIAAAAKTPVAAFCSSLSDLTGVGVSVLERSRVRRCNVSHDLMNRLAEIVSLANHDVLGT